MIEPAALAGRLLSHQQHADPADQWSLTRLAPPPALHGLVEGYCDYQDAPAAIEFLCQAFGFERHAVYLDPQDARIVRHAQLRFGAAMLMLGSAVPGEPQQPIRWQTPAEAGGVTACVYAVVADPDAHHARALAAGAEIVSAPQPNEGYPGRSYHARDPEGHEWNFGSYDPWAE